MNKHSIINFVAILDSLKRQLWEPDFDPHKSSGILVRDILNAINHPNEFPTQDLEADDILLLVHAYLDEVACRIAFDSIKNEGDYFEMGWKAAQLIGREIHFDRGDSLGLDSLPVFVIENSPIVLNWRHVNNIKRRLKERISDESNTKNPT